MTIKDVNPIHRMDKFINNLNKAQVFTSIYCNSCYLQIPIGESDRDKAAFISHHGRVRFVRMPFGLTSAPATLQRAICIFSKFCTVVFL